MGLLITAFVIGVVGLSVWIGGICAKRQGKSFEENKKYARAQVIGWQKADPHDVHSRWLLEVYLLDHNDGEMYLCKGKKIKPERYPKGMIVDVVYAERPILGVNITEVHLRNDPPSDITKLGIWLCRIGVAIMLITAALAIAGIVSLI